MGGRTWNVFFYSNFVTKQGDKFVKDVIVALKSIYIKEILCYYDQGFAKILSRRVYSVSWTRKFLWFYFLFVSCKSSLVS